MDSVDHFDISHAPFEQQAIRMKHCHESDLSRWPLGLGIDVSPEGMISLRCVRMIPIAIMKIVPCDASEPAPIFRQADIAICVELGDHRICLEEDLHELLSLLHVRRP